MNSAARLAKELFAINRRKREVSLQLRNSIQETLGFVSITFESPDEKAIQQVGELKCMIHAYELDDETDYDELEYLKESIPRKNKVDNLDIAGLLYLIRRDHSHLQETSKVLLALSIKHSVSVQDLGDALLGLLDS